MLTFKSTGRAARVYHATPEAKYMPAKMMCGGNMATGYDTVVETAETVTLLKDYNKGVSALRINGNSVQNGTPSPENPVEVESVGRLITDEADANFGKYEVPVVSRGKNFIPYPYTGGSQTKNGVTITVNDDGTLLLNGACTGTMYFSFVNNIQNQLDKNKQYTLSVNQYVPYSYIVFKVSKTGQSGTEYGLWQSGQLSRQFDLSVLDYDTINIFYYFDKRSVFNNVLLKPQLEEGTVATEYEPYTPPVTTSIYLDEPLRGIGDCRDYIEARGGAVKVCRSIGVSTENVTDAKPSSAYIGTMTQGGTAGESGSISVQSGETVYYMLSTPVVTDVTDSVEGLKLLDINTERGKTKKLTVTGGSITVEQCRLNTQEV